MSYSYNHGGIEYVVEDADGSNINDESTDNKEKAKKTNPLGRSGCLIRMLSFILVISGAIQGIKELKRDHTKDYCKWNAYFSSHQENQIISEINKRKYYIHERYTTDIMLASEYENIKDKVSSNAVIEYIPGPTILKKGTKRNELPDGYDYVDGGYAYKKVDEDQVKITAKVRILSMRKDIKGFENKGEYKLNNSDQIFVFAKSFNQDGKANDVKLVSLGEFDNYINSDYNFIGIADKDCYEITLFKTQYSSILNVESYNFSDALIEEKAIGSQKVK